MLNLKSKFTNTRLGGSHHPRKIVFICHSSAAVNTTSNRLLQQSLATLECFFVPPLFLRIDAYGLFSSLVIWP